MSVEIIGTFVIWVSRNALGGARISGQRIVRACDPSLVDGRDASRIRWWSGNARARLLVVMRRLGNGLVGTIEDRDPSAPRQIGVWSAKESRVPASLPSAV